MPTATLVDVRSQNDKKKKKELSLVKVVDIVFGGRLVAS